MRERPGDGCGPPSHAGAPKSSERAAYDGGEKRPRALGDEPSFGISVASEWKALGGWQRRGAARRAARQRECGGQRAGAGARPAWRRGWRRPARPRAAGRRAVALPPPLHPLRGHGRSLQGGCDETARRPTAVAGGAALRRRMRRRGGRREAGRGAGPLTHERGQGRSAEAAAANGGVTRVRKAVVAGAPASAVGAGGREVPSRAVRRGGRRRRARSGRGPASRRWRRQATRSRQERGRRGIRGPRRDSDNTAANGRQGRRRARRRAASSRRRSERSPLAESRRRVSGARGASRSWRADGRADAVSLCAQSRRRPLGAASRTGRAARSHDAEPTGPEERGRACEPESCGDGDESRQGQQEESAPTRHTHARQAGVTRAGSGKPTQGVEGGRRVAEHIAEEGTQDDVAVYFGSFQSEQMFQVFGIVSPRRGGGSGRRGRVPQ